MYKEQRNGLIRLIPILIYKSEYNFLLTVVVKVDCMLAGQRPDNDCVMRDGEALVPEFVARQRQVTGLKALHLIYEKETFLC